MFRRLLLLSVMSRRLKTQHPNWSNGITMTSRWHNDFQSTHNGKAPVQTDPNAKRKPRLLDDDHVEALREYIANQEEHHRSETFQEEFRRLLTKYSIEWDERYVWD